MAGARREKMVRSGDKGRQPHPEYKVGDRVWLDLRNVRTKGGKFSTRQNTYYVTELVGEKAVKLDMPGSLHKTFNVDLLRPVPDDPLPSQFQHRVPRPGPLTAGSEAEPEYEVEAVVAKRYSREEDRMLYEVVWKGYEETSWEPYENVDSLSALDTFLERMA
jgi:hypothetical protein